ncbi:hypothetical protein GCM10017673_37500 [Streptosporangium violaceochromogenes]|nr:hypothetical protein GCM10017673_37500 [Streptosporangium violaceochromogenes]
MRRRAERRVTTQPAHAELMALIARMRTDWDPDQIVAELAGLPWSEQLVLEAVRAAGTDDTRLSLAHALGRTRAARPAVTPEQLAAYAAHIRRRLPDPPEKR